MSDVKKKDHRYVRDVLGPRPGKEGRTSLTFFGWAIVYLIAAPILEYSNAWGWFGIIGIPLWYFVAFLAVMSLIIAMASGGSVEQNKAYHDLSEKLLSGEIEPTFYYSGSGKSDYLILDKQNNKLWVNTESFPASEINLIQINSRKNGSKVLSFFFEGMTINSVDRVFSGYESGNAHAVYARICKELNFS